MTAATESLDVSKAAPPPEVAGAAESVTAAVTATTATVLDAAQKFVSGRSLGSVPLSDLQGMLSRIGMGGSGGGGGGAGQRAAASGAVAAGASGRAAGGSVDGGSGSASDVSMDASELPGAWKALASVAGKVGCSAGHAVTA